MADVMDMPPEPPLLREDKRRDRKERPVDDRSNRRDRDPRDRREDDDRVSRRDYFDRRSDDERPGSAVGRDRDRDYKRRRTPSLSPPPLYRDRRSPPLRRSPSYKRSRRDDDYDGARRGSPRPSMDERRDRRMGPGPGRSNSFSGDERSYGRHHGFRSDFGRGGFSDAFDTSSRRDGLMSYKQFISELEDDVSPAEAERRYTEYKNEFISTQKKAFFEQNKQEDWLRDKYDPSRLQVAIQRRNEACKSAAREFHSELESGNLDISPNFTGQNAQNANEASDEEADDRRRRNGRGFAKDQELDAAPKAPAVSCEPRRIEKDIEQARELARKLDAEKGLERNILVTSDTDKSDGERSLSGGIINPIVIVRGANQVKGYEGVELLDVVITYLWRVHFVDYYGYKEYKEQPKVIRHVRGDSKVNEDGAEWEKKIDTTWQSRLQGQDPLEIMLAKDKIEITTAQALEPLIRKIKDEKYGWKYGCGAKNCTKLFHGPEFVQKHLKLKHPELVLEVAAKVHEELYFENYMSDAEAPGSTPVMATQKDRARRPRPDEPSRVNAGLPLPVPGRGGSREIERGSRASRDGDKLDKQEKAQDDEQFEQRNGEQSPSQEFQQSGAPFDSAGPFESGRGDTPMFDPFTGPGGIRGPPPFGADMGMPPVLMPVPGAGPLGPFVPAPPEVAMRLWREQGGAGSFHPGVYDGPFDSEGGNARGSRKRAGPSGGRMGAGLIETPPLPLPLPSMRPDSRRPLRSYRDLDAPEDEVTVIDYRSL
ncbi:hypothetical protein GOP47_0011125 [Adiantum capillus-veneris]|uniref:C2H2-type domain-containing protein n=1 Tax=Adiantum capillus-veneris TaxID=13818 RepID=A0A9D4USN6_ADICA|nr:hypothetical protein GOP47_0011125 [Adiantum capillus-veneris]